MVVLITGQHRRLDVAEQVVVVVVEIVRLYHVVLHAEPQIQAAALVAAALLITLVSAAMVVLVLSSFSYLQQQAHRH